MFEYHDYRFYLLFYFFFRFRRFQRLDVLKYENPHLPKPISLKWKIDFVCMNIISISYYRIKVPMTFIVSHYLCTFPSTINKFSRILEFCSFVWPFAELFRLHTFLSNRSYITSSSPLSLSLFFGRLIFDENVLTVSPSQTQWRLCSHSFFLVASIQKLRRHAAFPSPMCTKLSHWLYKIIYTKATCFFPHFSIYLVRYRIQLLFAMLQIVCLLFCCSWLFRYVTQLAKVSVYSETNMNEWQ